MARAPAGPPVVAAADSTGFDARPVSHYYVRARGRRSRQRRWPKLTAVADARTHLFLSAAVARGPSQDAPHLVPAVAAAVGNRPIDTLLADAGYDSEANHAACRGLGVRSTVIALNRRGTRKWPPTKYRRQMVRRFRRKRPGARHKRVYGQRWQVEGAFSRLKRRLGASVASVLWPNQQTEVLLKVVAHNILLLAAGVST